MPTLPNSIEAFRRHCLPRKATSTVAMQFTPRRSHIPFKALAIGMIHTLTCRSPIHALRLHIERNLHLFRLMLPKNDGKSRNINRHYPDCRAKQKPVCSNATLSTPKALRTKSLFQSRLIEHGAMGRRSGVLSQSQDLLFLLVATGPKAVEKARIALAKQITKGFAEE